MHTHLVGANFRPAEAKAVVMSLQVGDSLDLQQDPFNAYDPRAVKVLFNGSFLGFVPKEDNLEIFEHLSSGGEVSCIVTGFLSTLKPNIEIELL